MRLFHILAIRLLTLAFSFVNFSSLAHGAGDQPPEPPTSQTPTFTLPYILRLVERSNNELKALRAEVEQARLRWKESGRLWGPTLSVTGSAFESKGALGFGLGGFGSFGGAGPQAYEEFLEQTGDQQPTVPSVTKGAFLTAQVRTLIYTGGHFEAGRDQAFWAYQAAIANYERRRNEIFLDVIKAALTVLNMEHQLEVAERALKSVQELERITAKRVEAGASAHIELLRVQAQVAQAQVDRLRLNNQLEVARSFLRSLVGLPADASVSLRDFGPDITPAEPNYDIFQLRAEARNQRPEVKLAGARIAIAHASVKSASAGYKPAVQLTASRTWLDSNSFSEDNSWGVFLGISWILYDHGATGLRMAQTRQQLEGAKNLRDHTETLLNVEIDRAVNDWVTAYHSHQAALRGLEAARENLRLARLRYETGFSTHIEALDAERTLSAAEAQFHQTLYDYLSAKASLWKALGRSLPELPI
ncbi:MAG: TolC family protein [bacterium JZ-2024 1]